MSVFRFPRTRFADANGVKAQLEHCTSELLEAVTAHDASEGLQRVAEEALDCIHSLETLLRICQERGVNVAELFDWVERKNRMRGYYDC